MMSTLKHTDTDSCIHTGYTTQVQGNATIEVQYCDQRHRSH